MEKDEKESKGWESKRFCEYPQTLIIQFTEIVNLKEVQILCHEFKIPSKIELFSYVPLVAVESIPQEKMHSIKFNRIGHISFDSNERTNFTAREMKSVYVDFFAFILKLQISKCYSNKFNSFKQVGIMSLKCITSNNHIQPPIPMISTHPIEDQSTKLPESSPLETEEKKEEQSQSHQSSSSSPPPAPAPIPNIVRTEQTIEPVVVDIGTLNELHALEKEKEKAVQIEDFDEAMRLKSMIIQLKAVGKQLSELEHKKREAIKVEDYATAKKFKMEIQRLKGSVLSQEAPAKIRISRQGKRPDPHIISSHKELEQEESKGSSIIQQMNAEDEIVEIPKRKAKSKSPDRGEGARFPQVGEEDEEEFMKYESDRAEIIDSYDERVLPAVLKKRQGEQSQLAEEGAPPAKKEQPEPLSEATLIIAAPYKSSFDVNLMELLFSKHFYLREQGLDIIAQEVTSKKYSKITCTETEKILIAVIGIVQQMIQTKIFSLAAKALELLIQTMTAYKVDKKNSIINQSSIESMLDNLLEKLGESNALIKGKIEEALLELVKQNVISLNTLLLQIMKGNKKTNQIPVKFSQRRLSLVIQAIKKFEVEVKGMQIDPIFEYAFTSIRHTNREIRLGGYGILVEIYRIIGDKIDTYLQELLPAQRKVLRDELKKTLGAKTSLPPVIQEQVGKEAKEEKKEKVKEEKKVEKPKKEAKKVVETNKAKKGKEEVKKTPGKEGSKKKAEEKKVEETKKTNKSK